jgi:signal transduction histidine kinase/CheY-like chemotaxis protein
MSFAKEGKLLGSVGIICREGTDLPNVPVIEAFVRQASVALERRKVEEALRESNMRLEKTLDQLETTQDQVIRQERLRALGQMASGIAHDFNNALSPIFGFSELLLGIPGILDDREKVREYLLTINTAAQDASNIVKRLREFYRQREVDEMFAAVNINDLVDQAITLSQPKWKVQTQSTGVTIKIKTELSEIPPFIGNESELREVLMNLIFNAVDAMPGNGVITIRTRSDDHNVFIEVRDTGAGMTEEVRRRCLEPFFSTKGDHGTGLGLSMVYGIVQRHGGEIDIRSKEGEGTTFIVRIPLDSEEELGEDEVANYGDIGSLHVLVVDDDIPVLNVVTSYLGVDGHTVETATNGFEALAKYRRDRFDLVITDRAMPDMSGIQLANTIKQISPDATVIMLTGFGDMMKAHGELPENLDDILSKPVKLADFREAIGRCVKKTS